VNAAIEIHDSELVAVVITRKKVIIQLSPAYVHRSAERPGIDAGSGWNQSVDIVFVSGIVEGRLPNLPSTLDDGGITGSVNYNNLIPIPTSVSDEVCFEASTISGELIVVRGSGMEIKAVSEATYVEEFPGI
jgi:hypothetical protein